MNERLPPLTALRAFEAAARHLSFAKAAAELHVTPAALSFQIKSLEDHLGAPVFRRLNRAVELTEVGAQLAPGVSDGFDRLNVAWRAALRSQQEDMLTVTAGPAFTAKWLAPRLYDFAQAHPGIELRVSATLRRMSFERDDIDVAIRFGYGPDAGLFSVPLIDEVSLPVMVPRLTEVYGDPATLPRAPLIYDDSVDFLDPPADWAAWFRAAGVPGTPPGGTHFSQADHAIDAALAGAGVLLGRKSLLAKALAEGQLVAPYDVALATEARFRFLCRKGQETRPAIAAFRRWIQAEAARYAHVLEGKRIVVTGLPA
ncbi:transcriptional regulator GcvA [Mesobacterium sp. TK19101]|uniref:Transcriptional regulator GcvA n=1 Tax=Mesobacterium hydrothermale TaxID=3111907 RepID=A0ABU6HBW3_9RHOB|nr:transcriptional regulator GcvA [Mesobacterium sp. TK19101]MEC3859891.1 transcriptional regulator GcvA [Mesobacterium sp. TK19101]